MLSIHFRLKPCQPQPLIENKYRRPHRGSLKNPELVALWLQSAFLILPHLHAIHRLPSCYSSLSRTRATQRFHLGQTLAQNHGACFLSPLTTSAEISMFSGAAQLSNKESISHADSLATFSRSRFLSILFKDLVNISLLQLFTPTRICAFCGQHFRTRHWSAMILKRMNRCKRRCFWYAEAEAGGLETCGHGQEGLSPLLPLLRVLYPPSLTVYLST